MDQLGRSRRRRPRLAREPRSGKAADRSRRRRRTVPPAQSCSGAAAAFSSDVALDPDLLDQVELAFEEIDVLLLAFQDVQQQVARHEVAHALAIGDALAQIVERLFFQSQIGVAEFPRLSRRPRSGSGAGRSAGRRGKGYARSTCPRASFRRWTRRIRCLPSLVTPQCLRVRACRKYWLMAVSSLVSWVFRCSMTLGSRSMAFLPPRRT